MTNASSQRPGVLARLLPGDLLALAGQLEPRRRAGLGIQFLLIMASAVAETATLGAVVPFLALLSSVGGAKVDVPLIGLRLDIASASLLFCVVAVAGMVVRVVTQRQANQLAFGIGGDLARRVYHRILHQPYAWHARRSSSEVLASLAKVNTVVSGVINPLLQGVVATLTATGIVAALMLVDLKIASVAAGVVGSLYGVAMLVVRRQVLRNGRIVAESEALRIRAIQEGLGGIRDVLLEGTQDYFCEEFDHHNRRSRRALAANNLLAGMPRYFIETAGMILIVGLAVRMSGERQGLTGAVPVLGALALGAQRLLPQLQLIYFAWSNFRGNRAQLADVVELARLPMPEAPASQLLVQARATDPQAATPLVQLERVSFRYDTDGPAVLDRIDLAIARGSRIGVIGKTGCGKSTMVDIIMGLLVPTQGRILIDGEILHDGNRAVWQRRIAHVPQQIFLADTSIARNIAFGRTESALDIARVERAAQMAQLGDLVAGLEQSYESGTGERGVRLSGGQRQRIGIARALYREADLLVLDEATSALDDRTEAAVIETIAQLGRDVTIVMIAHRLSTLRTCDLIVELVGGRIVRVGQPAEILPPPAHSGTAVAAH